MRRIVLTFTGILLLAACSQGSDDAADYATSLDSEEAAPPRAAAEAMAGSSQASAEPSRPAAEIPVGTPQIAYIYSHGFRVPSPRIGPLQQQHADMCETKGPQVCRIISMHQSGNEGDYGYGELTLAVAAARARSFGKELAVAAEGAEGDLVSSSIEGEDLSKRMVDTEARLRARTLLRDRLMDILASRRGTVAELVAAERSVAQVNEEIDQASSWLAEMRGRVAFSRMNISYQSGQPESGGFMEPVRGALGSVSSILGMMLGAAIVIGVVLLPLALIIWGLLALRRRFDWRGSWNKARNKPNAATQDETPANEKTPASEDASGG